MEESYPHRRVLSSNYLSTSHTWLQVMIKQRHVYVQARMRLQVKLDMGAFGAQSVKPSILVTNAEWLAPMGVRVIILHCCCDSAIFDNC